MWPCRLAKLRNQADTQNFHQFTSQGSTEVTSYFCQARSTAGFNLPFVPPPAIPWSGLCNQSLAEPKTLSVKRVRLTAATAQWARGATHRLDPGDLHNPWRKWWGIGSLQTWKVFIEDLPWIYHELPHSYGKFDMLSGNNQVLNLYFGVSYSQTNAYYRTPGAALVWQAHPTKMAGCRPVHISVKMASTHNVSIIFKVICLKMGDCPK